MQILIIQKGMVQNQEHGTFKIPSERKKLMLFYEGETEKNVNI